MEGCLAAGVLFAIAAIIVPILYGHHLDTKAGLSRGKTAPSGNDTHDDADDLDDGQHEHVAAAFGRLTSSLAGLLNSHPIEGPALAREHFLTFEPQIVYDLLHHDHTLFVRAYSPDPSLAYEGLAILDLLFEDYFPPGRVLAQADLCVIAGDPEELGYLFLPLLQSRSASHRPYRAHYRYIYADSLYKLGFLDESIRNFRKVARLFPGYNGVEERIQRLVSERRRTRERDGEQPKRTQPETTRQSSLDAAFLSLGLPRSAQLPEATKAYRELISQYHPDRVSNLGPELRELALRKTQELTEAYRTVRSALGPRTSSDNEQT